LWWGRRRCSARLAVTAHAEPATSEHASLESATLRGERRTAVMERRRLKESKDEALASHW
jgi:hypothetical protein